MLYGDYLMNAQGEDVVAGIRNTKPHRRHGRGHARGLCRSSSTSATRLEKHYREMQDVEFTIERGKLWMLQTRDGKRTAKAAIKIAVDMVQRRPDHQGRGRPARQARAGRRRCSTPSSTWKPRSRPRTEGTYLASGVNASPGAAVGIAAFDADLAEEWGLEGKAVIMVRPETKPDDVHGMIASKGILTSRGGATSHAAVVARQFGTPAVVGCEAIEIDLDAAPVASPRQGRQRGRLDLDRRHHRRGLYRARSPPRLPALRSRPN